MVVSVPLADTRLLVGIRALADVKVAGVGGSEGSVMKPVGELTVVNSVKVMNTTLSDIAVAYGLLIVWCLWRLNFLLT